MIIKLLDRLFNSNKYSIFSNFSLLYKNINIFFVFIYFLFIFAILFIFGNFIPSNILEFSNLNLLNRFAVYFFFIFMAPIYLFLLFFKCLYHLFFFQLKAIIFQQHYFYSFDVLNDYLNTLKNTTQLVYNLDYSSSIVASYLLFFNKLKLLFSDIFINYLDYPLFFFFALFFLFTSFLSFLMLSYLGMYGVFLLNFVSLFLTWCSIIPYMFHIFKNNNYYYINLGKWMYLNNNYKINFDFFIDNIALSFAFLTITIAVFVYTYTFSYFRYEPLVDRLILLLNSFVISMVFLVCSGNLVMLFLGWEMIGLTSFFLINFWSSRVGTLKSAFKAFSFNKASDLFLFFAIILIFNLTYTLDIATFVSQIHLYENFLVTFFIYKVNYLELISIFLLGSAFIKSAQFGAHIWLPDSMEAPVPASALIHSATLVSAGIYLLLRFTALFELSNFSLTLISVVGALTAFYGGLVSMYQSDTKRILAYSTISHCGFLMVIYTTGVLEFVLLYLYVHGFFKAAVFLCVGNIIRFSKNNQDFKRMGSYYKYLPFDCLASFICLINLSGLPFTFGFYIKHLLFVGLNSNFILYYFVLINCLLGALTGLFYSYRLFYNVFFDFKKSKKKQYTYYNPKNLNSIHYSNTTVASTLAIISLIIVAYVVSLYLTYTYITKFYNFSGFSNNSNYISYIDNLYGSLNFLNNVGYINWIVIIIILSIIFTVWRLSFIRSNIFNLFFKYFMFFFWFYLFYFILL